MTPKPPTWPVPGGPRTIRRQGPILDRAFAMNAPSTRRQRKAKARIRRTYSRLGLVPQAR